MLRSIQLGNFRSCEDVVLENLAEVTVLIGRNSAGKSNILQGIAVAAFLASTGPGSPRLHNAFASLRGILLPGLGNVVSIKIEVQLDENYYIYQLRLSLPIGNGYRFGEQLNFSSNGGPFNDVFTRTGALLQVGSEQLRIGLGVGAMPTLVAVLPSDHPVLKITEPLLCFFERIRYFALDEPAAPDTRNMWFFEEEQYREWNAAYESSGTIGENVLPQLIYLKQNHPETFDELTQMLGERGVGLIEEVTVRESPPPGDEKDIPRIFIISFTPLTSRKEKQSLPFACLSQGTRRIIRLMIALLWEDSSVVLLEHPEDGVHKGLVRKLAAFFVDPIGESQIIVATHSDTFVNQFACEAIRFVAMEEGRTVARGLSPEEQEAASGYVNSEVGGTLAEFLHAVED